MAASTNIYELPDSTVYKGGKIYDRHGNLSYFADVDGLTDVVSSGGTDVQSEVKAHTRLPYMNSTSSISVPKHDRYVMTGVRQSKGALPGVRFRLESADESRYFTTTATSGCVYLFLKANAKVDLTMYWTGTPYDPITAASETSA